MKHLVFYLLMLVSIICQGQSSYKNAIAIEPIPYAEIDWHGGGLQINYQRFLKNNWNMIATYGVLQNYTYNTMASSIPKVNGVPIAEITSENNVYNTTHPVPFVIPDESLFQELENRGFKHVEPRSSYSHYNYFTSYIAYQMNSKKKWTYNFGFGLSVGLANISREAGAFSTEVTALGVTKEAWIVFTMKGRYWYYGFAERFDIERKINDRLTLGANLGIHVLMEKVKKGRVLVDDGIPYLGLNIKSKF